MLSSPDISVAARRIQKSYTKCSSLRIRASNDHVRRLPFLVFEQIRSLFFTYDKWTISMTKLQIDNIGVAISCKQLDTICTTLYNLESLDVKVRIRGAATQSITEPSADFVNSRIFFLSLLVRGYKKLHVVCAHTMPDLKDWLHYKQNIYQRTRRLESFAFVSHTDAITNDSWENTSLSYGLALFYLGNLHSLRVAITLDDTVMTELAKSHKLRELQFRARNGSTGENDGDDLVFFKPENFIKLQDICIIVPQHLHADFKDAIWISNPLAKLCLIAPILRLSTYE